MKNWDLKNILKQFKLNESTISMVLGAIVIIVVGVLIVNYFKSTDGDLLTGLTDNQTESSENSYTVAAGDTLWTIAEERYGDGFEWTRIAEANNLTEPYALEAGQVLTLPETESATVSEETESETAETEEASPVAVATPAPTIEPTETPEPTATTDDEHSTEPISATTYTVVHGDNLWTIATRAYGDGYKWSEIARENNLLNPNIIHPGNVLILPR